jgi:hypothetical protein
MSRRPRTCPKKTKHGVLPTGAFSISSCHVFFSDRQKEDESITSRAEEAEFDDSKIHHVFKRIG